MIQRNDELTDEEWSDPDQWNHCWHGAGPIMSLYYEWVSRASIEDVVIAWLEVFGLGLIIIYVWLMFKLAVMAAANLI